MDTAEHLNQEQKKAVLHTVGPLLVIAGAGTGKTRVLTHRIARLIQSGVSPERILAVTFTNKAAKEMRERVISLIKEAGVQNTPFHIYETPFIGTFHSLGVFILRESGKYIGIKQNFSIKDRDDSLRLLKEAMKTLGVPKNQYIPSKILAIIGKQKGNLLSPHAYLEESSHADFFDNVGRIWEEYESLLKKENSLDFDDLILKTVFLLKTHKQVLEHYQEKWLYVHIDEYQDTNEAQYMISALLSQKHKNICAVGDGDQNIYSWRGANIKNILRFEKDYIGANIMFLEENYRSTDVIVGVANEIIKKNKLRKERNLFTQKKDGEKISLFVADTEETEAYFVTEKTSDLLLRGILPEEIAVLYRANFQSRILEEAFLARDIPYQIIGTRFFERKEVKDIISFIKASLNTESLSDIRRIINVPPRGIGKSTIAKLFSGNTENISGGTKERLQEFFSLLKKIKTACVEKCPSEIIAFVMKESGVEAYFKNDGEDGRERLENIKELGALASRYDNLPSEDRFQKFLTDVALASDQDAIEDKKNGVRLMTVHAAKGLEFKYVFIVGLEQGLFPHKRDEESAESKEEERRLFYVALTRAKEKLFLSFATRRTLFGSSYDSAPSEFLNDIPQELIEYTNKINENIICV
ncbi:MAG: UvrD-helicase domain-containing protein [bacterium]|nr:UvrD-helicase domain-containing protein [bacterium]